MKRAIEFAIEYVNKAKWLRKADTNKCHEAE